MVLCFGGLQLDMLLFRKPLQICYMKMLIYIKKWTIIYSQYIEILN